jgi:hypothetical protein
VVAVSLGITKTAVNYFLFKIDYQIIKFNKI